MIQKKLIFTLITIIFITLLVQLFVNNGLAGTGSKLSSIREQTKRVDQEILSLKEEIAGITSLKELSVAAYNLGFVKPDQVVYWDVDTPLALLNTSQSR